MRAFNVILTLLTLAVSSVQAKPFAGVSHRDLHLQHERDLHQRATGRFVFAHIIIGIVGNRNGVADWDADMKRAKAVGIDAFALNIGTDSYTDQQLQYAYDSAKNNGMKCFISFDFNWWSTGSAQQVGQKISQYGSHPAQLLVDGKVFVSTFVGDGLDVGAVRAATSQPIYFAPNFHPSYGTSLASVDAAFNWMGWPNNGYNRAPNQGQTGTVEAGDQAYINALGGKDYLAPASPWFFTHYGRDVSYSKNWVFPGDTLWFDRWTRLLQLGPRFVEIVSWNDYGESHYVGPLSSPHNDDGASKWVNDMPHDGWLDMAKPYIAAYKAGATSVNQYIASDMLTYWYRPQPKTENCDATDTCMTPPAGGDYYLGKPNGYDVSFTDSVFVVSLLKTAGTLKVTSGGNTQTFSVPAGASIQTVPMGIGKQTFTLSRNGQTVLSGTSAKDIINGCVCGLYNFNAYVGTLPAGPLNALQPAGLSNFANGLKVSTCAARPSLTSASSAPTSTSSQTTTKSSTTTTKPTSSSSSVRTTTTTKSSVSTTTTKASTSTPTTTKPSVTTTSTRSTTVSTSASTTKASTTCNAGTGQGNYSGLCSFACQYGYCPSGPCTCTSYGTPATPPPSRGIKGVPANGLDQSYSGLCSYDCDHGYCPSTACQTVS